MQIDKKMLKMPSAKGEQNWDGDGGAGPKADKKLSRMPGKNVTDWE